MPALRPVTRADFQDKRWRRLTNNYSFVAEQSVIPLMVSEFGRAALDMPTAFIKQESGFIPVALLSPLPGRNLFVGAQGQWLGGYIPAYLRAHPFSLARAEGSSELVLCIAEDDSNILPGTASTGHDFFNSAGGIAPETAKVLDFLTALEQSRAMTQAIATALGDSGLLQPWTLNVNLGNGVIPAQGLYRIEEAAIARLDDESFLALRRAGALPIAYIHVMSTLQIIKFSQLAQTLSRPTPSANPDASEMEKLFAQIDPNGELFG